MFWHLINFDQCWPRSQQVSSNGVKTSSVLTDLRSCQLGRLQRKLIYGKIVLNGYLAELTTKGYYEEVY
jgi:hypothetical protein